MSVRTCKAYAIGLGIFWVWIVTGILMTTVINPGALSGPNGEPANRTVTIGFHGGATTP